MAARTGPLAGIKVIELAHVMAGPTCGLMLADLGADVIKVEKIPGGDDTRSFLPPAVGGESAAFLMMNRNKRGIALDLKSEDGKRVLRRLLEGADVLTESYRKGMMERMGFGYETLKRDYPRLVYCSVSGFGRTGPYADRAGFDLVAQGMSGLMSITGEGPGRPPVKVGAPASDITAGILAAMGVVAALHARANTGAGQLVDTSLFEAGITLTYWQSAIALATGKAPGPMGSAQPLNAPYQASRPRTAGSRSAPPTNPTGSALSSSWGGRILQSTRASKRNADRIQHQAVLAEVLAPDFRKRTSAEWLELFERAKLPPDRARRVADAVERADARA